MKREDWLNIYTIGRHLGYGEQRIRLWKSRYKNYKKRKTRGVPTVDRDNFVEGAKELGIKLSHDDFERWDKYE